MNSRQGRPIKIALFATIVIIVQLCGCATSEIRALAKTQSRSGQYGQAIGTIQSALKSDPDNASLRAGLSEVRTEALTAYLGGATAARLAGQLDETERLLKLALEIDPGNVRVLALLSELDVDRGQAGALSDAKILVESGKVGAAQRLISDALKRNPRQAELLALQRRLEMEQRQAQVRTTQLGLEETRPISLDFRDANLRSVLDVVSRNSGLNFIIDKDVRPDVRVTVLLHAAPVEAAIDLIASTYQLSKKVIDRKTVFIYPNTPEKQREHQEQVVKVFHLASAEAKGAEAFLKSMLKLRDVYVNERSNMVAIRDSQDNIHLAERLMALYDSNEPEVLLEVEIIEVRTSRLAELGVKFPDTFSISVLAPENDTGLTLANVRGLTRDRIGLSIGGVTVNLKKENGDFNILANPRVRVRNKEKAKILIGDKVPVITTTTGIGGFVSDNVNYIDVGLKLDVEPTISIDDEVAIKIALEVSSLSSQTRTASGTLAYQIGTRNASTLLRLRDGETQLLAGLISTEDRGNASRLPGVGDIPGVGRLFTNQRDETMRTELVLSITPRVMRNIRRLDASESEFWVGTEAMPRLRPVGGMAVATASAESMARSAQAAVTGAAPDVMGARPAATGPTTPPFSPPSTVLQWAGPTSIGVGDTFVMSLTARTSTPLRGMPVELAHDKERLALLSISEGDFFRQGGAETSFTHSVEPSLGRARAGTLRNTGSGAVGQGTVFTVRMKALKAGSVDLSVIGATPMGASGPVPLAPLPSVRVEVSQ